LVIRLINDRDPDRMVCLTSRAWHSILEIAEQHGWLPIGAAQPEWLWGSGNWLLLDEEQDQFPNQISYGDGRLVLLDDALNLADALERAFLAFEPERIRSYTDLTLSGVFGPARNGKPGIGTILEVAAFCQSGAFWIEMY